MHRPDDRFSSWTGEDSCGWRGVACDDATGHVTKLDLRYRYAYSMEDEYYTLKTMGGSKVNPSLQRLKHLKYLDLSMISSLVHLEYLNLSHAMFDGPIPPRFGNLSNLRYLDLQGWYGYYHLRVDDLEWLTRIPSLKYLDMSEANLSNATNWLYTVNSIPKLRVLCLSDANLPSVPSPLPPFNLTAMARLDLSKNYNIMATMLRWLSNATSLDTLIFLAICSITGQIPPSVGNLTELEYLDLSSNNVVGSIPETIGSMVHLETLNLFDNSVAGQLPETMGRLHCLKSLDIAYNELSGQLPTTMGDLCNLTLLDLSYNNIAGELTDLLSGLSTCSRGSSLLSLFMKGNNLSGIIPSSMGQLSQLQFQCLICP
ncbi:unnamed protein product [Musa hybrid cultivar]